MRAVVQRVNSASVTGNRTDQRQRQRQRLNSPRDKQDAVLSSVDSASGSWQRYICMVYTGTNSSLLIPHIHTHIHICIYTVDNKVVGQIGKGLCVLIGIHQDDTEADMEYMYVSYVMYMHHTPSIQYLLVYVVQTFSCIQ